MWIILLTAALFCLNETLNASAIETRAFIEKPPIITNLIFEVQKNSGFPLSNSTNLSTRSYFARIQGDSIFLQAFSEKRELTNTLESPFPRRVVMFSDPKGSWAVNDSYVALFDSRTLNEVWDQERAALIYEKHSFGDLQALLNLGVKDVSIRSLQGNERSFVWTNRNSIVISGRFIEVNDRLTGVNITHELNNETFAYKVSYEYGGSDIPEYIPSKITRSLTKGDQDIVESVFYVKELHTNIVGVSIEQFAWSRFKDRTADRVTITNNTLMVKAAGSWVPMQTATQISTTNGIYKQFIVFIAFAIFSTITLVIWWKETKNKSQ